MEQNSQSAQTYSVARDVAEQYAQTLVDECLHVAAIFDCDFANEGQGGLGTPQASPCLNVDLLKSWLDGDDSPNLATGGATSASQVPALTEKAPLSSLPTIEKIQEAAIKWRTKVEVASVVKPTLTGDARLSETERLRCLVDPRYRESFKRSSLAQEGRQRLLNHVMPSSEEAQQMVLPNAQARRTDSGPAAMMAGNMHRLVSCRSPRNQCLDPHCQKVGIRGLLGSGHTGGRKEVSLDVHVTKSSRSSSRKTTRSSFHPGEDADVPQTLDKAAKERLVSRWNAAQGRVPRSSRRRSVKTPSSCPFNCWRNTTNWRATTENYRTPRLAVVEVPAEEDMLESKIKNRYQNNCPPTVGEMPFPVKCWRTRQLAKENRMPVEVVEMVKQVFESLDVEGTGALNIEEFEVAVKKLLEVNVKWATPDSVKSMSDWPWWDTDSAQPNTIDFSEFLKWYSSNSFKEDLLLTGPQKHVRSIAKRYNVSPDYVEKIKLSFDACIKNESEEVTLDEFRQLLYKILRVPSDCEIPENRIRFFFVQIDADGSNKVAFAEFFDWWMMFFSPNETSKEMPIETFYRSVRRMGGDSLDPPPYCLDRNADEIWPRHPRHEMRTTRTQPSQPGKNLTRALHPFSCG